MRWTAPAIAGAAETAGFRGPALVDAVALALAASGGDDRHRLVAGRHEDYDERGLWGVDVAGLGPDVQDAAYDPAWNARAAHDLYLAAGGTFDWSPVWRAGILPATRQEAVQAVESGIRSMSFDEAMSAQRGIPWRPRGA